MSGSSQGSSQGSAQTTERGGAASAPGGITRAAQKELDKQAENVKRHRARLNVVQRPRGRTPDAPRVSLPAPIPTMEVALETLAGAAQGEGNTEQVVQLPKVPPGPVPAGQQQDQVVGGNDQQKGPDYGWNYPLVWSKKDLAVASYLLGGEPEGEEEKAFWYAAEQMKDTWPGP